MKKGFVAEFVLQNQAGKGSIFSFLDMPKRELPRSLRICAPLLRRYTLCAWITLATASRVQNCRDRDRAGRMVVERVLAQGGRRNTPALATKTASVHAAGRNLCSTTLAVRRMASEVAMRVAPRMMTSIPTSVPIAQTELDGQWARISKESSTVTAASNRSHPRLPLSALKPST